MSFKAKQSVLASPNPRRSGPAVSTAGASVLIVDDSDTMRTIVRGMLQQLGFQQLDEAENGSVALSMIKTRSYTLIISDWHMEPVNGIELLQAVRRISKPGINRFIFSTSESSWGSQTSAKVSGAEAFLVKPFTIEALKGKIETVLLRG